MKDLTRESIELLRKMVRIPSESFHEEEVSDLIFRALDGWGLSPCRYGKNVVCKSESYNPEHPSLVLDAHMDTVAPAQTYTRDPYNPGDDPSVVYGLGSNDDGGSVAAMIAAFRYFRGRELPFNLILDINCEEERSGPAGDRMLFSEEGPAELRNARWVIVGEPTGMKAAISERGLLVLDAEASGVSGHAARNEGVNAIYAALRDIEALRSHEFSRISPTMGKVRLNVTQINAGTAHNVIPDKCTFVVDIRPTEQYTNREILEELQSLCTSTLTPRNLTNRASATYPGSPLLKTLEQLGVETFSSPTTSNWVRIDKDAIKMGPGESSRSHRADEYILASEIEGAVEGYIRFIETFYGNTLE